MNTKVSILVIEDEKDVRKVLKYSLKSDGFDVYSAADGPAGLKIAGEKRPDVILLDWVMPKMTGLEVLSELRQNERTKDIIVFMLTAKNMVDDVSTALASGAHDYIIKPFDGAELGQRIMSMLRAVKKLKEDSVRESEKVVSISHKAIDTLTSINDVFKVVSRTELKLRNVRGSLQMRNSMPILLVEDEPTDVILVKITDS